AEVVQHPVPANRGRPAAEPGLVTAEPAEIADDAQPCLGSDVLRRVTHLSPQIADKPRMDRPVQQPERVLVALLRRADRGRQPGIFGTGTWRAGHAPIMCHRPAASPLSE